MRLLQKIFLFIVVALSTSCCSATVVISEIARKGTSNACNGHDWLELYNTGSEAVDLSNGYVLHDNKGLDDEDAFHFPTITIIEPLEYLVLCNKVRQATDSLVELVDPTSPQFGIGRGDKISLARFFDGNNNATELSNFTSIIAVAQGRNKGSAYSIVSKVGPLPDIDDAFNVTYALDLTKGDYIYTSTPTPAQPNVITPLKTPEERVAERKARMAEQDALGTAFFNMDSAGLPVEDGMGDVLDMHITMTEEDYDYTKKNAHEELYRPFQSMTIQTPEGEEIATYNSAGRIRPKGQTTLYISQCLGTETIPFQVDMDYYNPAQASTNKDQSLFGVERFYLRHHMSDNSYMRDWAYNRMLAQFGLPYLRARTVRLYINGQEKPTGLYTLIEAPDNEYVFARNFPSYTPESFALYKLTNLGNDCGEYSPEQITNATERLDEVSTPPYAFERGEHRQPIQELGELGWTKCAANYIQDTEVRDKEDVVLAWLRYGKDCAKMRMEEGLVDRDLGTSDWDGPMEDFLRTHLDRSQDSCDPLCANSDLAEDVDVENFLKTMAFYAVTLNQDSPLGKGTNVYLLQSGDGKGWKLQAYDFNFPFAANCQSEVCNERLIHWSIVRPTCTSLEDNQLAGPLLTDPTLQSQYLQYVKEFVDHIYSNSSLVDEMTRHFNAIRPFAAQDFYTFFLGVGLDEEESPDAAEWNTGRNRFPLLPIMKARSADVRAQLQAIDDGSFARGPFVSATDNDPWEVCADWRQAEPETSMCEQGCRYEGCHIDGWTIESYCDEDTGTCYHGYDDPSCENIVEGQQYPGIESIHGRRTFCRLAKGMPVKASECPGVGEYSIVNLKKGQEDSRTETLKSSSGTSFLRSWGFQAILALSMILFLRR